ncbi:hypothetical protein ACFQYP_20875 [Nonomuraea antimicrobica]
MKMIDELNRAHRELLDGTRKALVLSRHYDAEVEDVCRPAPTPSG